MFQVFIAERLDTVSILDLRNGHRSGGIQDLRFSIAFKPPLLQSFLDRTRRVPNFDEARISRNIKCIYVTIFEVF
jgi:hypothetical protein